MIQILMKKCLFRIFSIVRCEKKIFGATKSLTPNFSTVVNFSIRDILDRIHGINTINYVLQEISDEFIFRRELEKATHSTKSISLTDLMITILKRLLIETLRDATLDLHDLAIQEDTEDHKKVTCHHGKKMIFSLKMKMQMIKTIPGKRKK